MTTISSRPSPISSQNFSLKTNGTQDTNAKGTDSKDAAQVPQQIQELMKAIQDLMKKMGGEDGFDKEGGKCGKAGGKDSKCKLGGEDDSSMDPSAILKQLQQLMSKPPEVSSI